MRPVHLLEVAECFWRRREILLKVVDGVEKAGNLKVVLFLFLKILHGE